MHGGREECHVSGAAVKLGGNVTESEAWGVRLVLKATLQWACCKK